MIRCLLTMTNGMNSINNEHVKAKGSKNFLPVGSGRFRSVPVGSGRFRSDPPPMVGEKGPVGSGRFRSVPVGSGRFRSA